MSREVAPPGASWLKLLALFSLANFAETMFIGQMGAFTPLYLPQLGVQAQEVARWTGIVAATSGLLGLPFLPFWGALADRYARQPVIVRSYVVQTVAGLVAVLAGNVWVFLLGRTIASLALGNTGLMLTTLAERIPAHRQGVGFAIINSSGPVGVFIGPLIGGPIVDHFGFRALLAVNAALMLAMALALTFGYRDQFRGTDRGPLLKMAADSVAIIFRSPRLRTLLLALFVLFAGWMLAVTYAPLAVAQLHRGPDQATAVGIILGAGGLLALLIAPVFGALADRFGHWRVLFVGGLLEMVLWPLPALVQGLAPFGAAWAIINGIGSGVFAISFSVLSRSATCAERGRVMSFAYLPVNVGVIAGSAIGSLVTQAGVFAVFPAAAVLTAAGMAILALARRQPGPGDAAA